MVDYLDCTHNLALFHCGYSFSWKAHFCERYNCLTMVLRKQICDTYIADQWWQIVVGGCFNQLSEKFNSFSVTSGMPHSFWVSCVAYPIVILLGCNVREWEIPHFDFSFSRRVTLIPLGGLSEIKAYGSRKLVFWLTRMGRPFPTKCV